MTTPLNATTQSEFDIDSTTKSQTTITTTVSHRTLPAFEDDRNERIHRQAVRDKVQRILTEANAYTDNYRSSVLPLLNGGSRELAAAAADAATGEPAQQADISNTFRYGIARSGADVTKVLKDMAYAFDSYEQYLSAQITTIDRFFVNDEAVLQNLVELGLRGGGGARPTTQRDFEQEQRAAVLTHTVRRQAARRTRQLHSAGADCAHSALLQALKEREARNYTGDLRSVIFLRAINDEQHEVSGYIDFSASITTSFTPGSKGGRDWRAIFSGKQRLLPNRRDLSYFNWHTLFVAQNNSKFFKLYQPTKAFTTTMVQCREDQHSFPIGAPSAESLADTSTERVELPHVDHYLQVVLYDHANRAFYNREPTPDRVLVRQQAT